MRCVECGAEPSGEETCLDRFHALLAAELNEPEAFSVHGLFVLTYYAQHPSLCQPWMKAANRETLREAFGEGRDWREVLAWPKDRARRQEAADLMKARHASTLAAREFGEPVAGELTVVELPVPGSPQYPSEYPGRVEAWAWSVNEHRYR